MNTQVKCSVPRCQFPATNKCTICGKLLCEGHSSFMTRPQKCRGCCARYCASCMWKKKGHCVHCGELVTKL